MSPMERRSYFSNATAASTNNSDFSKRLERRALMRLHHLAASVAACLLILVGPAHSLTVRAKQEQCPPGNRIPTCPPPQQQQQQKQVKPHVKWHLKPNPVKVTKPPPPQLAPDDSRPQYKDYGTCTDPKQRGC
jgi:hypothetical protein